ncbi:MAG: FAD dependent oxidoreductase [Monoraphidium minutum]|nr:MAG: FAD dependent oxidoreductase [Monoraphidium minutum]
MWQASLLRASRVLKHSVESLAAAQGAAIGAPRGFAAAALGGGAASKADVDCVVIGAGVVGLAVARSVAQAGYEVVILEKEAAIGTGSSSRNSEVIHAGIYYAPGSLKAQLCVEGKGLLYDYCAARGVGHARTGKLIVATAPGQEERLEKIRANAATNGVTDLQRLSAAEAVALEPELRCSGALLSPSTGIVDSHGLMEMLLGDAEAAGASLAVNSRLAGADLAAGPGGLKALQVEDAATGEASRLTCKWLVNAAGLDAQPVASRMAGLPPSSVPPRVLCKGSYFSLSGAPPPFSRLIYPMPEPGGLGVHVTLDLGGQVRFGPDIEWVDEISYAVDPGRAAKFYGLIREYWPGLPDSALAPAYAGVRPKVATASAAPGVAPAGDFVIQGAAAHGVAGLAALYGMESPGLTSCLAIGDHVLRLLQDGWGRR